MADEPQEILTTPQLPPVDIEAEKAALSCMLYDTEGIVGVLEGLNSKDFYNPRHIVIFEAIEELYNENTDVNAITVKNKLEKNNTLEGSGGFEYLLELTNFVSTSAGVSQYVKIIKEKSSLRKLINLSAEINRQSFSYDKSANEIVAFTEDYLNKLTDESSGDFVKINDIIKQSVNRIEEASKNKNKITGVPTGFLDFDLITSGLQPSDLILIAARPAMGKTAFALNIAQHAAIFENVPTALFSLEMSEEQLVTRMLCSLGMIDSNKVRTGTLDADDWDKLVSAISDLSDSPVYIYDSSNVTPMDIRTKCRKLQKEKGLGLIVIDYLQLMSGNRRNDSRQQEISEISRSLKNIARELNVPVIALSQLSRAVEQRPNHRPVLSDLRESGAIEQDADIVCFLYRDDYYTKEECENPGIAEVIIEKHRSGSLGKVELKWRGEFTRFFTIDKQY